MLIFPNGWGNVLRVEISGLSPAIKNNNYSTIIIL